MHKDGFLAFNTILHFCRSSGYNASESEIIAVIRRLDVDADQRIKYEEFAKIM
jgi:Ca2+-binding EF-hand superfamily protein